MNDSPLLSVCMITYNHEPYIREAIEGVLMQKTDFPIELIISEDCSTDKTRDIVKEYADKYPDIIIADLPDKNRGMNVNALHNKKLARGKYLAICEGDDYWTDPLKLQKQVDFLEANPDFSICFHAVDIKNETEGELVADYITPDVPDVTDIHDLAWGNYIHTLSAVYRVSMEVLAEYEVLPDLPVGDYPYNMINAKLGKIKKFPDVMGIYRIHASGVWSETSLEYRQLAWLNVLDSIMPLFDNSVKDILKKQYGTMALNLSDSFFSSGDNERARCFFEKAACYYPGLVYKRNEELRAALKKIQKTREYRLGRIILKPFRLLKRIFKR